MHEVCKIMAEIEQKFILNRLGFFGSSSAENVLEKKTVSNHYRTLATFKLGSNSPKAVHAAIISCPDVNVSAD